MADRKDLVVPPLGESITEAVIGKWLKNVGDPVAADEPVVDLETDKVTVQLPAPCAGTLAEQRYQAGDTVRVGESVGQVEEGAGTRPAAAPEPAPARPAAVAAEPAAVPARPTPEPARPAATPARPTAAPEPPESSDTDVEEAALRRLTPSQRRAARLGETAPHAEQGRSVQPRVSMPEPEDESALPRVHEEVVSMSPLRRRIAERLVQAQRESASLTTFNEVDMSGIMELRKRHQDAFVSAYGIKLGFMSFFAKACAAACKLYPGLNAEIRGDSIVYKKHYDFGVAVSTERGLVVPVLRGVDRMSFADIEQGIAELAGKARDSKLTIDDLTGGTFTITNGGIFGSMLSTPLLNYPQTGIMGMHNIVNRPVAIGDRVEVRPIMYLALTYDHRVVDGREAVQFLVAVKERVEQPDKLMFEL